MQNHLMVLVIIAFSIANAWESVTGRFPWLGDYPLSAVLAGSFDHLHKEHEPAIRAWLAESPT